MRATRICVAAAMALCAGASARPALAAFDNFVPADYLNGGVQADGKTINNVDDTGGASGGIDWTGTWTTTSQGAATTFNGSIGSAAGITSDPYVVQVADNYTENYRTFTPQSGTVYAYLLARTETFQTTNAFFALEVLNDASNAKVGIGQGWQSSTFGTGEAVEAATTYLLLTKVDLGSGQTSFWVNPDLTQAEGTADLTGTTSITSLDQIAFRYRGNPWQVDNVTVTSDSPFAVPEPTSLSAIILGSGLLLRRRVSRA